MVKAENVMLEKMENPKQLNKVEQLKQVNIVKENNMIKVKCAKCGTEKTIPNTTCTWQCPVCSIANTYIKPVSKKLKKFIKKISDENNPLDYEY